MIGRGRERTQRCAGDTPARRLAPQFVTCASLALLWTGLGVSGAHAGDDYGYASYSQWLNWARYEPNTATGLASSFDRSGANNDYSQYDDPPGLIRDEIPCTVRVLTGPGILYRFWMPHLTAKRGFDVHLYFDDEDAARIDTTSNVLLAGDYGYFAAPLVDTFAGGQVCYDPIPFARSLRIATVNKPLPPDDKWSPNRHYYQYTYRTYPPDTPIASYDGTLSEEQQAARDAVVALFENAGQHPGGNDPDAVVLTVPAGTIDAGQTLALAQLTGPGLVRRLNLRMDNATDEALDGLRLRVTYDDDAAPTIDVAIADFFGAGHARAAYRSLVLGTDSADGCYCYWPLPYRRSVAVALYNPLAVGIAIDGAVVEYKDTGLNPGLGYLHAIANVTERAPDQVYHTLLTTTGRGHYVGNLLYVRQSSNDFGLLEGDDEIAVDGVTSLLGTGLEDAYNGGYYYNWVGSQSDEPEGVKPRSAIRPLNGILYVDRRPDPPLARADQYRWLIGDRVSFAKSLDVKIECRYAAVDSQWRSVAFWYQQPDWPGDLNCDGRVDFADIDPFVLALTGEDPYTQQYPDCPWQLADINGDGSVDFGDIDPFVELLVGE